MGYAFLLENRLSNTKRRKEGGGKKRESFFPGCKTRVFHRRFLCLRIWTTSYKTLSFSSPERPPPSTIRAYWQSSLKKTKVMPGQWGAASNPSLGDFDSTHPKSQGTWEAVMRWRTAFLSPTLDSIFQQPPEPRKKVWAEFNLVYDFLVWLSWLISCSLNFFPS